MYRLVATGTEGEWIFSVPEAESALGSSSDNDLVLPVPGVSRRHAFVRPAAGGVEISDRRSKNGILLGGKRVQSVLLTPGLRVQIGAAWVELQEVSSVAGPAGGYAGMPPAQGLTASAPTVPDPRDPSSPEAALRIAYHLVLAGAGTAGKRQGLLAQLRSTLGAEVLAVLLFRPSRGLAIVEGDGPQLAAEADVLAAALGRTRTWPASEVRVRRAGAVLAAGRDTWSLAARFRDEAMARAAWRRDFLRIVAEQFFAPVQALAGLELSEARRAYEMTGGNVRKTARLLGKSPTTVYKLLGESIKKTSRS